MPCSPKILPLLLLLTLALLQVPGERRGGGGVEAQRQRNKALLKVTYFKGTQTSWELPASQNLLYVIKNKQTNK